MYYKYAKYGTITAWSLLGVHRGIKAYDYSFNKNTKLYYDYDKDKYRYLYSVALFYGLAGFGVYINPFLLLVTIPKEVYRLEVNLRGLEDEKKTDYFNQLI
jgi:hypothetical protein